MKQEIKADLLSILGEELEIAQGCTEPIAGAYTSAIATRILDEPVTRIEVVASQNIIKNAKGVVIPGTKDLMGIEASVVLGMLIGDAKLKMEVLKDVNEAAIVKTKELLANNFVTLNTAKTQAKLLMSVRVFSKNSTAEAVIMHMHTNVVRIEKNGILLKNSPCDENDFNTQLTSKEHLTIKNIYDFATNIDLDEVKIIDTQIKYNSAIAKMGMTKKWGAAVGLLSKQETLNEGLEFDIRRRAFTMAAAASDARMSGCALPVVTVNGSGNQGMTVALAIIEYANHYHISEINLKRAILFGDLVAIRLKQSVGRLSALCGATFAAIGAIAGILYMLEYDLDVINKMIQNSIANNTGVICDGAKASCALKIYSGLDTALLSATLAINESVIAAGVGIIQQDVEDTIDGLKLISDAMVNVDTAVMQIMMK